HSGRLVQADREARVPDGAAAPPFRIDRLEGAEGDRALRDPRDRLRALQSHHLEAAMTTPFSVERKRVVVVGAARSGVAAAELLVRRAAGVTAPSCAPD